MATAAKPVPTKKQVVGHLIQLLDKADQLGLQLGDRAAIERTIRILKRK